MVKRIGTIRRKTRNKLSKKITQRGKVTITRYLQHFDVGDKVGIVIEPSVHKGMPHPRFYGKVAVVRSKKGNCYEVIFKDGKKEKTLIAHPVHLKKIK